MSSTNYTLKMIEQAKFYASNYKVPQNLQIKDKHKIVKPHSSNRRELFYDEDLQRIPVRSERAKLISQLMQPDDTKEFTSNFYCRGNKHHAVITSHRAPASLLKRKPIITTHPTVTSNIRWDPNVYTRESESHFDLDSTEIDCEDDVYSIDTHVCDNCRKVHYPESKTQWTNNFKRFDDNIAVFCDQYTNTPRLNDAGCGSNIPMNNGRIHTCDINVSPDIKDCSDYSKYSERNEEIYPRPWHIQKSLRESNLERINLVGDNRCYHDNPLKDLQEAVRDTDIPEEPIKFRSQSSFRNISNEKVTSDITKKTLYNEGIKDNIPDRFPDTLIRIPSPINMLRDNGSRTSATSKPENLIPYSYKIESKYHHGCKNSPHTHYYTDPVPDEVKSAGRKLSNKYYYTYEPYKESPKVPRRVLSSEKNIEKFITTRRYNPKITYPLKKCLKMDAIS